MENQEMENQKRGNQKREPDGELKTPEAKARVGLMRCWNGRAGRWWTVRAIMRCRWRMVEALREGLLKGSLEADYLLMVAGKVVGVLGG